MITMLILRRIFMDSTPTVDRIFMGLTLIPT